MICDDSDSARKGLKAALSTWAELKIVADVSNGEEALTEVGESRPHVVLMDARMPVMDGVQATRALKARWPKVRVIVLSMYPQFRRNAIEAGADVFLTKGGPVEELVDAIVGHHDATDDAQT